MENNIMTQEQKQLLLKDICGRLPYGVIMTNIELPETHYPLTCEDINDAMFDDDWDDVPYLRPMSSMTEEEHKVYNAMCIDSEFGYNKSYAVPAIDAIDWLNAHYFDYRGLIEKGLALEAPDGMYQNI